MSSIIIHNQIGFLILIALPIQYSIYKNLYGNGKYPKWFPAFWTFASFVSAALFAYFMRGDKTQDEILLTFITTTYVSVWWCLACDDIFPGKKEINK